MSLQWSHLHCLADRIVYRLTRDATLAELTSLEQLMSVMMTQGVVEDDVITKLWQVYSE